MTSSDHKYFGTFRKIHLALKIKWVSHLCAIGRFNDAAATAGKIADATQGSRGGQRMYVIASIMQCSALMWGGQIEKARAALAGLDGAIIGCLNGANRQYLLLYCHKLSAALGVSKDFHLYMSHSPDVDALSASEWLKRALPLE